MSIAAYSLFETSIGQCGLAWGEHGLLCVALPEHHEARTRARVLMHCPGAVETTPPAQILLWIDAIQRLLQGEPRNLQEIDLDMATIPELNRRVYDVARRIPPGQTRTYGEIALELGDPLLARAVGQTLGQNPFPIVVPCHRVLAANRSLGGFSAPGGTRTKARMLAIEGVEVGEQLSLF